MPDRTTVVPPGSRLTRRRLIARTSALALAVRQSAAVASAQDAVPSTTPPVKDGRRGPSSQQMRRLLAGGGAPPRFETTTAPRIGSGVEAIVRPLTVALCDLDVAYLANLLPTPRPFALGHEFTAEVVEIGSAVKSLKPGDRVTVPFQISCGGCSPCRAARSLDCSRVEPLSTFGLEPFGGGSKWGGALSDLVKIPFADAMAIKLPAKADLVAMASLSDNVVDGYRCVAPHVHPADEVLVIGSASIGLYAVAVARALGISCTYVDNAAMRLKVAERLGARVIESVADGRSFGEFAVTAACNSTPGGLQSAIRSTTGGGICQSAGIHFRPVELPLVDMYRRGIRLSMGRASARDHLPAVLDLIAQGRLNPGEIGPTVIELRDAPRALQSPLSHKTIIKMV